MRRTRKLGREFVDLSPDRGPVDSMRCRSKVLTVGQKVVVGNKNGRIVALEDPQKIDRLEVVTVELDGTTDLKLTRFDQVMSLEEFAAMQPELAYA